MQRQRLNPEGLKPKATVRSACLVARESPFPGTRAAGGRCATLGPASSTPSQTSPCTEDPEGGTHPKRWGSSWNPGLPASRLGHGHQPAWPPSGSVRPVSFLVKPFLPFPISSVQDTQQAFKRISNGTKCNKNQPSPDGVTKLLCIIFLINLLNYPGQGPSDLFIDGETEARTGRLTRPRPLVPQVTGAAGPRALMS